MNMTNRKNFSISVDQDENNNVDISISNSHDFNVDTEYDDVVKKLTSIFEKTNKSK